MDLIVEGGQRPHGTVRVSGAKNSATRLMAAALLTDQPVHLDNFPTALVDVQVKASLLRELGAEVVLDDGMSSAEITAGTLDPDRVKQFDYPIRTTYLLAAGQLLRGGRARIPYPAGCRSGVRKYDLHVSVWERMGCEVRERDDHIEIVTSGLRPGKIDFPFPTIGGTENALLCASITRGKTQIANAYISPEVSDLIQVLTEMGARIHVVGNSKIEVEGSRSLRGTSHRVIPDRIEALTWIVYGALSRGEILIEDVPRSSMEVPMIHLWNAGLDLFANSRDVLVQPGCLRAGAVQPFEVACGTYPGVISDMQPLFVMLALQADGKSKIVDYRYPDRTAYLEQLAKLCPGAVTWERGEIRVRGPATLRGADVQSTDLRGSMVLILAGLLAEGTTTIRDASVALRGYNRLPDRLADLGISTKTSG